MMNAAAPSSAVSAKPNSQWLRRPGIPSLNEAMVLELVRCEFLPCKEGHLTLLGSLQLSFFYANQAEMQS